MVLLLILDIEVPADLVLSGIDYIKALYYLKLIFQISTIYHFNFYYPNPNPFSKLKPDNLKPDYVIKN